MNESSSALPSDPGAAGELMACPWCGGSTGYKSIAGFGRDVVPVAHRIHCGSCGSTGPDKSSKALAIEAWNRVAAQAAELGRMRAIAKEAERVYAWWSSNGRSDPLTFVEAMGKLDAALRAHGGGAAT